MNTMQFLMAVLNWLESDPSHVVVAASAIAALTPTPNPASRAGRLYKLLEVLALNFLRAKETGITPAAVAEQVIALLEQKKAADSSVVSQPSPKEPA